MTVPSRVVPVVLHAGGSHNPHWQLSFDLTLAPGIECTPGATILIGAGIYTFASTQQSEDTNPLQLISQEDSLHQVLNILLTEPAVKHLRSDDIVITPASDHTIHYEQYVNGRVYNSGSISLSRPAWKIPPLPGYQFIYIQLGAPIDRHDPEWWGLRFGTMVPEDTRFCSGAPLTVTNYGEGALTAIQTGRYMDLSNYIVVQATSHEPQLRTVLEFLLRSSTVWTSEPHPIGTDLCITYHPDTADFTYCWRRSDGTIKETGSITT